MIFFIAFISLIGLIIIHEFGHFILAKKFGVKVEEFGIGYPPRLFGKKFGETIYSLNLLPFGAFVKMPGEIEKTDDPGSFSKKPIWQRFLIVFGGALSFWIVSVILLSIVFGMGTPQAISDEETQNLVNPKVQIVAIASRSPAESAGIRVGDAIKELSTINDRLLVNKVKEVQDFTNLHKGQEITLTIERGKEIFTAPLIARALPPEGEGPMGINLVRTAIKSYPWYQAPWQGILATIDLTIGVIKGWIQALKNVILGLPSGVQLMGPVGIFHLFTQASQLGINYFLNFIAVISICVALFNILPIPAVDGGKILFLGIEAVRKRPVSQKVEEKITTTFFMMLILLMVWVTVQDITRIF